MIRTLLLAGDPYPDSLNGLIPHPDPFYGLFGPVLDLSFNWYPDSFNGFLLYPDPFYGLIEMGAFS